MDDGLDSLRKWRLQMETLSNPLREFQKQQDLLRDPFREMRERDKLFKIATGELGTASIVDTLRSKSLIEQQAEAMRPLVDQLSGVGLASRASDSIAALMGVGKHQLALQAQIKDLIGPTAAATALADSFNRGFPAGFEDAIRGNLGNIASTIAGLQNPFSIDAIAKRMSFDTGMIEAAHAYLSEEEELAAHDGEVVSAAEKVVRTLNANTVKRFEEMSWFEVIGALYFLLTMLVQYHDDLEQEAHRKATEETLEQSAENAEEIEKLNRLVAESAETIDAIAARAAEYERIAELPRAIAPKGAQVRIEPMGSAKRIAVLERGQQCAVEEVSGRWVRCTYFDELTQKPRTGWVWKGSLQFVS